MSKGFKNNILLTGAGFSKNFGGLLASEMYSGIFSNPILRELPDIKNILRQNTNFEFVYAEVVRSENYTPDEKMKFHNIVKGVYERMDNSLLGYIHAGCTGYDINLENVRRLIGSFASAKPDLVGCHFTLNQDRFLERLNRQKALGLATLKYKDYGDAIAEHRLDSSFTVSLPDEAFIEDFKQHHLESQGDLHYIKLHGSLGWQSVYGGDKLILGMDKFQDMKQEPLLKWYMSLFEQAIYRKNVRLLIIGYSFGDDHINERLTKAIEEFGLEIHIVSPENPMARLYGDQKTRVISENIEGYYAGGLVNIFPEKVHTLTPVGADLMEKFGYRD